MNDLLNLGQMPSILFFAAYLWSILWKGLALWRAATLRQKNWFIAILILNTLGILDIIYLFFLAKKKMTLSELKFWETK